MAPVPTSIKSRWIGRVLADRYRIDTQLARGGTGTVFAGMDAETSSPVAIKVLHSQLSRDLDTRSRFVREGYAASRIGHPGVVSIFADGETEDGLVYLVMELLEGELLEDRRTRVGGMLPVADVYDLADQLLDVLGAAHANGIIHRDIKPENVFVTRTGQLKVLDFGLARVENHGRGEQTATGILLGTPGFMAPEQATGARHAIDGRTDLWGVGATLFLLLTGKHVHEGGSAAELLVASANEPARSLAVVAPHVPAQLRSAIDRALAFEPSDRWPDARAMQAALRVVPRGGRDASTSRLAEWMVLAFIASATMIVVILLGLLVIVATE